MGPPLLPGDLVELWGGCALFHVDDPEQVTRASGHIKRTQLDEPETLATVLSSVTRRWTNSRTQLTSTYAFVLAQGMLGWVNVESIVAVRVKDGSAW